MTAQARVEDSISDVRDMIQHRLGMDGPWETEWVEEVQGLLERDAGWGWNGFWSTIRRNILVSAHVPLAQRTSGLVGDRKITDGRIRRLLKSCRRVRYFGTSKCEALSSGTRCCPSGTY